MEQNEQLEFTKTQLKVQALLETTGELHNQIAEYRAEVTMLGAEVQRLAKENQDLRDAAVVTEDDTEAADESVEEPQDATADDQE